MLDVVIPQDGITCLMENISVMLALITCIAGKTAHTCIIINIPADYSLEYDCIHICEHYVIVH